MKVKTNSELFKEKLEFERKKKLQEDLKYIKLEVIAKQKNGNYCKYSRLAHCITVVDITKQKYLDYWISSLKAKNISNSDLKLIEKAVENKFNTGLYNLDKLVELELKSKDTKKEKDYIIKTITSKK